MSSTKKSESGAFSPNDLVIRSLGAEDKAIVNEFFDALGVESAFFINHMNGNRERTLDYCANAFSNQRFWVAMMNDKIVGLVFFIGWDTTIPSLGIAVRDDLKGMHLGSRLMDYGIEQVKKAGKGGIRLTTHFANLRGQALYEKKGFRRMGQHTNGCEFFYLLWFSDEQS